MRKRLAASFLALTVAGCAASPAPVVLITEVPPTPSKPVAKPTPKPVKPPDPNARFRSLIQTALKTPRPSHPTVPKLARLLTRQCRNDQEKALVLYTWIASHIHYDRYAAAHDEARPDQSGQATLHRGSAVCEGYSRLFVSLAQECGLNAVKLSGFVKSWDKVVVDDDDYHCWNAAYWDNRWHLLDCTWGAGDIKSGTYPPKYFDVPPEQMLASHFPDDPAWQLRLRAPMTRYQFDHQCVRKPAFFALGMELADTWLAQVNIEKQGLIHLRAPEDVFVQAHLYQGDRAISSGGLLISRRGDLIALGIRPPRPGRYRLQVYASRSDLPSSPAVLTYHINCSQGWDVWPAYPRFQPAFQKEGVQLHEPLQGSLKEGKHHFKLSAPGARSVLVLSGGETFKLTRDDDSFEGDVVVAEGGAQVLARYGLLSLGPDSLLYFKAAP